MTDAPEPIVLYDLACKPTSKCWSPNPWKTRFMLNYKGLNYRTEWTEYPEFRTKLQDHLPPNEQVPAYTCPTVKFPDGKYVMDSKAIAQELETRFPNPSAHLDSPQLAKLESPLLNVFIYTSIIVAPLCPERLLNEASLLHYYKSIPERTGMTVEQMREKAEASQPWQDTKPHIDAITELLADDDRGPYFLGDQVSYADFMWGGALIFYQRLGSDVWDQFLETASNPEPHIKLLEGLEKWSARDDH